MQDIKYIDKEYFLSTVSKAGDSLSNDEQKAAALEALKGTELPNRKVELWRHTSVEPLLTENYSPAEQVNVSGDIKELLKVDNQGLLVFVNGFYNSTLSQIKESDVVLTSLKEAKSKHNKLFNQYFGKTEKQNKEFFSQLNNAYAQDGAFVFIPKKSVVDKPLHIVFIDSKGEKAYFNQYRNLIVAEAFSEAKIIVSQISEGENTHFNNALTEIFVNDNAHLEVNWLQNESKESKTLNYVFVKQGENSHFFQNHFSLQNQFVRNDVVLDMEGENSEAKIQGIYIPRFRQHFDNTILVQHKVPHCDSHQIFKGIVNDEASSNFYGKVLVAQDAQKTNANQSNRNILLTKRAKASSKPQLEIYADDVACSHGSTTGQLDKEALFYMQSRGIAADTAQRLLLYAFVGDVMEDISIPELKEYINKVLHKRFD